MRKTLLYAVLAGLVGGALAFGGLIALGGGGGDLAARTYDVDVYRTSQGNKLVIASGGELEVQSGGTLDLQSGSTLGSDEALALNSTLDVDGATTLNSTLDVDGNITSGTGAVTVTDNVVVTGTLSADTISENTSAAGVTIDGLRLKDGKVDANLDVTGTLQYGADDLYALGFASSGRQLVYGTETMTNTATAAHGLTTVTWALCTLGEDVDTDDGDPVLCTAAVAGNVVTISSWQDDWSAASTSHTVHWLVVGVP